MLLVIGLTIIVILKCWLGVVVEWCVSEPFLGTEVGEVDIWIWVGWCGFDIRNHLLEVWLFLLYNLLQLVDNVSEELSVGVWWRSLSEQTNIIGWSCWDICIQSTLFFTILFTFILIFLLTFIFTFLLTFLFILPMASLIFFSTTHFTSLLLYPKVRFLLASLLIDHP